MNLIGCKKGKYVLIKTFQNDTPIKIKRRLLDLGFTPGQKVRILRKSILKKVFLVEIRKFVLSLRREIVQYILVEGI